MSIMSPQAPSTVTITQVLEGNGSNATVTVSSSAGGEVEPKAVDCVPSGKSGKKKECKVESLQTQSAEPLQIEALINTKDPIYVVRSSPWCFIPIGFWNAPWEMLRFDLTEKRQFFGSGVKLKKFGSKEITNALAYWAATHGEKAPVIHRMV